MNLPRRDLDNFDFLGRLLFNLLGCFPLRRASTNRRLGKILAIHVFVFVDGLLGLATIGWWRCPHVLGELAPMVLFFLICHTT